MFVVLKKSLVAHVAPGYNVNRVFGPFASREEGNKFAAAQVPMSQMVYEVMSLLVEADY